jgi:SAM-dependent methyltransferase
MEPATRDRLSTSFDRGTPAYAAARPSYPVEAALWLVGSSPADVLDLGAGTGSLTSTMTGLGHRVVAAELSAPMLATLRQRNPVPAVRSAAEQLPFRAGSFDTVTVATAFHWFDASAALPEIAEALRPGGRLGLVWNSRVEGDGWPGRLGDLLRNAQPETLRGDWGPDSTVHVAESPLFEPLERAEFAFTQTLDRVGLQALVASRSYVIDLKPDPRRQLLDRVGELFDEVAEPRPEEGAAPAVAMPYVARCWRAATVGR